MDSRRFLTHSLRDLRVVRILAAALDAVEPGRIVRDYLQNANLLKHNRVFLLGIGKAAEPMTFSAADVLTHFTDALIITKHASDTDRKRITVMKAGHPVPDEHSLAAGRAALGFVSRLREDDLLICLISGGGSALVTAPFEEIFLADLQTMTSSLLSCGATIDEINILRRQLDRIKGGGLIHATKARVISLILSDVIGDNLETIASGPTAPNPTTGKEALAILAKYGIEPNIPSSILTILTQDQKQDNAVFDRVQNVIVGNNLTAAQAARTRAEAEGFHAELLSTNIQGEAREVGAQLARTLKESLKTKQRPFCLISGGETTVTIRGDGKGGRNQELALAAVDELDGLHDAMLISLATDGDDGPTDAAGAVVTGETRQRAERLGTSAADYLSRNDAYSFFDSLGDLLKPGYSGTNVNDLIFLFGL